jgi:hypothetical protein
MSTPELRFPEPPLADEVVVGTQFSLLPQDPRGER